jgi:hypothetical protein
MILKNYTKEKKHNQAYLSSFSFFFPESLTFNSFTTIKGLQQQNIY